MAGVMLTGLADVCRKSGLRVVEVAGWSTRHVPGKALTGVQSIMLHHTATSSRAQGNMPTLFILRDGLPGLRGPLCQLGLGRDGTVYVVAAGYANHAGATWESWEWNQHSIGIEVEHPGDGPIEGVQLDALVDLVRVLRAAYRVPLSHVVSHAEAAKPRGRKVDIRNRMDHVRELIAAPAKTGPGSNVAVARPEGYGRYLTVNGVLNEGTVRLLQRFLDAQGGFDFGPHGGFDGQLGPYTVSALQVWIARQGGRIGAADGVFGARSARGLEAVLGQPAEKVEGWYPGLVRDVQRRLNVWVASGK